MTHVVRLIGHPVAHSLSPRMQNAAFDALGMGDWEYVAVDVQPDELQGAVGSLDAGANVTAPYKQDVARIVGSDLPSVNTLVPGGGAYSTDAAILDGLEFGTAAIVGDGGAAAAFRHALPDARLFSRRTSWPPQVDDADLVIHATSVRDDVLFELRPGQILVDLPYPRTATALAAAAAGATVLDGLEVLVAQGARSFELWTGRTAPMSAMRSALGLSA